MRWQGELGKALAMPAPSVPQIFSRPRRIARALRHQRLAGTDLQGQFLRAAMAEDIAERLGFMQIAPCQSLIHGDTPGLLARELKPRGFACIASDPASMDEELPYPQSGFGLIANLCSLDTVNDLPGALIHARKALAPGGLFIACLTGAGSMPSLRQILLAADGERPAARIHPQIDTLAASGLMQRAGFSRQVVDGYTLRASYRSFAQLVADLRAQGLNNALADPPPPLNRAALVRAHEAFAALGDDQGRVAESFEILTLTGWA